MTDSHPFFRAIWRLNALVILAVGLIGGLIATWGLIQIARDVLRPRAIEGVMRVPEADRRETLSLSGFTPAPGGRYLVGSVSGEQEGFESGYSKTIGSTRDLVILDRASNTTTRALGRADRVILSWSYPVADEEKPANPSLLLLTVIEADTDGNQRLDGADRRTLVTCLPSGLDCQPLMTDIEGILSQSVRADGRIDLILTRGGATLWHVLSPDRTLSPPTTLPAIP